ncbi:type I restriction-modification system subunit M [Ligilactobacillus ceti]|uniref:site-specific DNA-methyltransferase (adenine-specific) n=1 Tax=Ligilactobacillus ceti DSM 22408 TaxID=1122146 RepID=A0A0R2KH46_9LACO|nr:class I SAM-dependent DNA methyltransferase [Ligilactobacillus ceti]KRN88686.1 type I restriction-modification [Ligilactobacillus ceti DSM 22408]
MNEVMWDDSAINVTTEVNFIWSIANKLRPTYTEEKYKDVIIPMTIIRRFECALADTKEKVLEAMSKNPNRTYRELCKISGFPFYNTSPFDLEKLCNDPEGIADNLKSYINAFSSNVKDILFSVEKGLDFEKQIDKMDKNDRLYNVVKAFSELDLDPKTIDNMKMGYIFEDLIRRFSENAEAGDHYTGRDIIKLMVSILLAEGCDDIFDDHKVITIADYACGTGGMLSTSYNYIKRYNPTADIRLFGQEINPESYAICLAEMLIKDQNAEAIKYQDSMKKDSFENTKMRFVIENPPFGTSWGGKDAASGTEKAVKEEYLKGKTGRFPAGLPKTNDMQMLFLQAAIEKMDDKHGRAAIIQNGSPLFSGGTSSGESQIRRYLLENDLIEAIIALPTDLFYNTGIATYIWILSKCKRNERKGKVQLIDASSFFNKLRKALGNKRNELDAIDREKITKLYAEFSENEYSKIYDNEDFMYREYTILQPLQRSYAITKQRIENLIASDALNTLYNEVKAAELTEKEKLSTKEKKQLEAFRENKEKYDAIIDALKENIDEKIYMNKEAFTPVFRQTVEHIEIDKKLEEKIINALSIMDKNADIQKDKKGNIIYDTSKEYKDTEIVPIKISIETYMEKEVLPHIPDAKAFFEEKLGAKKPIIKTGAEIPFTRYFYKYETLEKSETYAKEFKDLEEQIKTHLTNLFKRGEI